MSACPSLAPPPSRHALAAAVLETRVQRLVLLEQLILEVAVAQDIPVLVQVDLV